MRLLDAVGAYMDMEKVNWFELSDSQKADVLKQAKAFLRKRLNEASISRTPAAGK